MSNPAPGAPAPIVTLANALAKAPWFEGFDAEAAFGAYKEQVFPAAPSGMVTAAQLKEVFLARGYDKAPEPAAPAEGEEAKAPEPAEASKHAEAAFALLDEKKAGALHVSAVLGTLFVCKGGFGEPALRFALKAVATDESGSLKEAPLFQALGVAASSELNEAQRTNLRRAWRTAAKFEPPQPEPPAEGEEAKPPVVVKPEDTAVMVDDFVAKLAEDPALAFVYTREVPVPIEKPADAAPAE